MLLQDFPERLCPATLSGCATPKIWALTHGRCGDNAQALALAEALGWGYEVKPIARTWLELPVLLGLGASLAGVDRATRSGLQPPWPDIVIGAGRQTESVARWIRSQAGGGRVRLVYIGRPWSPLRCYGLIVTTPQYALPQDPNVLCVDMPLHRVTIERLAQASRAWAARVSHLPRPRIAVLVGGSAGRYTFDAEAARRLGRQVGARARRTGGSLLVSTSYRTSAAATEALERTLEGPGMLFRWSNAEGAENPVEAVLGFLFEAESRAIAPRDSGLCAKEAGIPTDVQVDYPCAEPATPSALPTALFDRSGRKLRIEHWADGSRQRDTVKLWAGMGGYSGAALTRDLLAQIAAWPPGVKSSAATDPFAVSTRQSSSFRFDPRGSYVPLDLGFSLNEHSDMGVSGYPLVELLAAIGLQNARPRMTDKLNYSYKVWSTELPAQLARACLGAEDLGFPFRRYRMRLGWPGKEGQARCILFAWEEPVHD